MKRVLTALLVFICVGSFAQSNAHHCERSAAISALPQTPIGALTFFTPTTLFTHSYTSVGLFNNTTSYKPAFTLRTITYTLPKGAVFCHMEDALHSRFNLWIKFRMGDNDAFSN